MVIAGFVCVFVCYSQSDNDDAGMSAVINYITAFIMSVVFGFCKFCPWSKLGDLGEIFVPIAIVLSLVALVYGIIVLICLLFGKDPISGLFYLVAIVLLYVGFIIMADIVVGLFGLFLFIVVGSVALSGMLLGQ